MGFMAKKKEATPTARPPVAKIKVGVKREATLDLGDETTISLTMVAPGLTGPAVQQLMQEIDDDGYLTVMVMPREDADGQGKNNSKPGQ